MNNYTIYCTESQTKKAFELGAPIEYADNFNAYLPHEMIDFVGESDKMECAQFVIPSVEQMLGWLEEQEEISDLHIYKMIQSWTFDLYASNGDGKNEHPLFQSRKEATLAAIDAALEYLSKNKK